MGLWSDKRGGALANHRIKKESYVDGNLSQTTYYIRDVAGQVMAIYSDGGGSMALVERPIYGSGRIGVAYSSCQSGAEGGGNTLHELTDHLGNVWAVFSKDQGNTDLEGYTDYYAFGMPMPQRNTLEGEAQYRYAFQGQEKDDETGKEAFELRLWDSRIGRWLTTDPAGQFASPYLGMGNNPIIGIDSDGAWVKGAGFFRNLFKSDGRIYAEDALASGNYIDGRIQKISSGIFSVNYTEQNELGDIYFKSDYYSKAGGSSPFQSMTQGSVLNLFSRTGGDLSGIGDYLGNLGSAASMTFDWASGNGAEYRVFYNTSESLALKDAWRVNQARDFFYNKYENGNFAGGTVIGFSGAFGLEGLYRAGLDPIEQFVGSYSLNIHSNGKLLLFTIYNTTSFQSLAYGIGPNWERSTFKPGGNMRQIYLWTEPLRN